MKKLLLLCALPLSLGMFSFISATTGTGVTDEKDGYYDISSTNTITAQDVASISQQIADIYNISIDPSKDYILNVNTGTTGTWALSTTISRSAIAQRCVYGDIPVLPNNNIIELQNISATLQAYVVNN